ncbi:unnamed protein product [Zymoseptoria tritici ST99CH_3D1]|nr:unnamed protein product [Zymoseptoria tritici ST99CH_3D1]
MAAARKKTTATYHTIRERDSVRSEAKPRFKPKMTVRTTSPAVSNEDLPSCADETPIRGPEDNDKAIPVVFEAFPIAADFKGPAAAATIVPEDCTGSSTSLRPDPLKPAQLSKPLPSMQSVLDVPPHLTERRATTPVQRDHLPHQSSGMSPTPFVVQQPFIFGANQVSVPLAASSSEPRLCFFGTNRANNLASTHAKTKSEQNFAFGSSKSWDQRASAMDTKSPFDASPGGNRKLVAEIVHKAWLQLQTWHDLFGRGSREFNLQLQTVEGREKVMDLIAGLMHVADYLNGGTTDWGYALGALWVAGEAEEILKEVHDISVILKDLGVGKYGVPLKEEAGKEVIRVEEAVRSCAENRKRLMDVQANDKKRYLARQATSHVARPESGPKAGLGSNSLDAMRVRTESHTDLVFAYARPLDGNGEFRLPPLASNEQEIPGRRSTGESGDDMLDVPADLDAASHKPEEPRTEQKAFKVSYAAPEYSSDSSNDAEDWEAEISDSDSEDGGVKLV